MKRILSLTALAIFAAPSAFAAIVLNPTLTYRWTNGPVAPQYRLTRTCTLSQGVVTKVSTGGFVGVSRTQTNIAWTNRVPNEKVLGQLLNDAAIGDMSQQASPVGGPSSSYEGSFRTPTSRSAVSVTLKNNREINTSREARTLVKFMDFNCQAQ